MKQIVFSSVLFFLFLLKFGCGEDPTRMNGDNNGRTPSDTLNTPTNLIAIVSEDTVTLSWDAPETLSTQQVELKLDDGSFEDFRGFGDGRGIQANGPFVPPAYPAFIILAKFLTNGFQVGTDVNINVYVDSTGQADRPAASLLAGSVRTTMILGRKFQSVEMNTLSVVLNSGNFFIGVESLGQGNIGLGNDVDATGEQWVDGNLDGIFSVADAPGVFAIRAVVGIPDTTNQAARQQVGMLRSEPPIVAFAVDPNDSDQSIEHIVGAGFSADINVEDHLDKDSAYDRTVGTYVTLLGYNIYRSTIPNARTTGAVVAEVNANTTTFVETNLNQGTFFYQVTAVYAEGESGPSNEVFATLSG